MATGFVLAAMIVFSPWAFGTTQGWSVGVMNAGGYVLGGFLLGKAFLRRRLFLPGSTGLRRVRAALLLTTALIVGYVLVAAINAEFTYVGAEFRRDPHPYVRWLPHSLDQVASWRVFWNALALACAFWATHDWLTTDLTDEGQLRTRRLQWLIGLLAVNGGLVAIEAILQRTSGTAKLLWFQPTHDNPTASAQFGPYAYRANAAQFFNLIWPPALALWWLLQRRAADARAQQRRHWLLPPIILLVIAPLVSLSRGGAGVALLQICACAGVIGVRRRFSAVVRWQMGAVFLLTIAAAIYLGGNQMAQRLPETLVDPLSGRTATYEIASRMTTDYPWFGIGPGAFDSVFQMYRNSPEDYWPAQLHNDWLEYLITFGRVGMGLLILAGLLIGLRWRMAGGLRVPWIFAAFLWIAIGGCLLHARFDFPLQIYSIQFVFVLLCAVLFSVSGARGA